MDFKPLSALVIGSSGFIGIIHGDGNQRRDLTHVSDMARAVGLALRRQGTSPAILNVGTGRNHSVMDMAAAATKTAARKSADILSASIYRESHPVDVPETLASTIAVRKHLGWAPAVFFPGAPVMAETCNLERSTTTA